MLKNLLLVKAFVTGTLHIDCVCIFDQQFAVPFMGVLENLW